MSDSHVRIHRRDTKGYEPEYFAHQTSNTLVLTGEDLTKYFCLAMVSLYKPGLVRTHINLNNEAQGMKSFLFTLKKQMKITIHIKIALNTKTSDSIKWMIVKEEDNGELIPINIPKDDNKVEYNLFDIELLPGKYILIVNCIQIGFDASSSINCSRRLHELLC